MLFSNTFIVSSTAMEDRTTLAVVMVVDVLVHQRVAR
jgi:hypothetical protein